MCYCTAVFPLGFWLVRICPNVKFIEIFAHKFYYFEDPFYKFFALNLLFQDTSHSLALKYSSFLWKFFSFAFYNINFWFKISKICPKILHFSQISHSRGNTAALCYIVCLPNKTCSFSRFKFCTLYLISMEYCINVHYAIYQVYGIYLHIPYIEMNWSRILFRTHIRSSITGFTLF